MIRGGREKKNREREREREKERERKRERKRERERERKREREGDTTHTRDAHGAMVHCLISLLPYNTGQAVYDHLRQVLVLGNSDASLVSSKRGRERARERERLREREISVLY